MLIPSKTIILLFSATEAAVGRYSIKELPGENKFLSFQLCHSSVSRYAYGIVSLSLALGILLASHPRWGYAILALFAVLLVSHNTNLPGGNGWRRTEKKITSAAVDSLVSPITKLNCQSFSIHLSEISLYILSSVTTLLIPVSVSSVCIFIEGLTCWQQRRIRRSFSV